MNGMQLKTVFIFSSLKLNCNSKKANIYPIFWSVCSSSRREGDGVKGVNMGYCILASENQHENWNLVFTNIGN